MNTKLIRLIALLGIGFALAAAAGIDGKISDYGIFKETGDQDSFGAPQSPSGVGHIIHSPPMLVATTNRIPAKLGIGFGVAYEVQNPAAEDGEQLNAEIRVSYPSITRPDGSISKSFTTYNQSFYQKHKAIGSIVYTFDHDYEVVTGTWRFEVTVGGKLIGNKEFTVYRE
ncbi:MAG TPA: DUF3859 domain-containing protein [Candidatus Acidoferrum sp.]|jgi:hypothetical protein|nr:DUF3859 domain-containing protein [Candidatus Acidoferrum sp.]